MRPPTTTSFFLSFLQSILSLLLPIPDDRTLPPVSPYRRAFFASPTRETMP